MKWYSKYCFIVLLLPFIVCASDKGVDIPLGYDPDQPESREVQFERWFRVTFVNPPEPRCWFDEISPTVFRLNWREEQVGVLQTYDCSLDEAWILTYLIEDKVEGGLDRLHIDSGAEFGPGKEQAITLAVLGNRAKCVHYLLGRGDADDFLDWLLKIAETKKRVPAIQGLIKKRIAAIQSDKTEVP